MNHLSSSVCRTRFLGRHVLAEFFGCNANILNNLSLIETQMKEAAVACGATIVESCFHLFNPYGVSGVVVISESHLAIHTWPEVGYAAVDLFTCGESCDPMVAFEYLEKVFGAKQTAYQALHRGLVDTKTQALLPLPAVMDSQSPAQHMIEEHLGYNPHITRRERLGVSPTSFADIAQVATSQSSLERLEEAQTQVVSG